MGLFQKTRQRIIVSCEEQHTLERLADELRARKLQDTKVSSVQYANGRLQCSIACKSAEALYGQELLPLLLDTVEAQACEVLLAFDDESAIVARCPQEMLVSFGFDSRYAFGNEAENEFIQKLHGDILQSSQDGAAAVSYYIVGGGAVTMCMPCTDPKALEKDIRNKLGAFKIKRFEITVVDREPA